MGQVSSSKGGEKELSSRPASAPACSVLFSPCQGLPMPAFSPTSQQADEVIFSLISLLPFLLIWVMSPSSPPLAPCGHKIRNLILGPGKMWTNKISHLRASADNYNSLSSRPTQRRAEPEPGRALPAATPGAALPIPLHPYGSLSVWGGGATSPPPCALPLRGPRCAEPTRHHAQKHQGGCRTSSLQGYRGACIGCGGLERMQPKPAMIAAQMK